jgi:hypothetical protein
MVSALFIHNVSVKGKKFSSVTVMEKAETSAGTVHPCALSKAEVV